MGIFTTAGTLFLLLLGGCVTGGYGPDGSGGWDSGDSGGSNRSVSIASCLAFRGYQQTCGQPVTVDEYSACLDNLSLIEANCYVTERDRYDASLASLYACLGEAGYCPGDAIDAASFACYQTFDAETADWLGACTQ